MQQLLPHPEDEPDLARLYATGPAPAVRLGMVTSVDGAAALGGLSRALSGPPDRQVFSLLRSLTDVVLVGAGTARAEGYRPAVVTPERSAVRRAGGLRPTPVVAVVSRGGGLPVDSPLLAPGAGTLLVTTVEGARAAPPGLDVLVTGETEVDLSVGLAELRARGLAQVLCEGGPALAAALVTAGLVDELCLSTSPQLAGGTGPRLLDPAASLGRPLVLRSLLHEDGWLLARWALLPAA